MRKILSRKRSCGHSQLFESFRGESAKPWLLTIVRNTSMTWLKRHRNAAATIAFEEGLADPGLSVRRTPKRVC